MLHNNSYPLSYVLIHYALKLGDTEAILRMPSYVAGVAGIWLMYYLGRACYNRRVGLVASFLLAFSSVHIYYSQDGRFYSLMPLAAIVCLWTLTRALQSPRPYKYWIGYAIGVVGGTLSHPMFMPFTATLGAGGLAAILFRPKSYGRKLPSFLQLCVFTGIGLIPLALVYASFEKVALPINTGKEGQRYYLLGFNAYYYYVQRLLLFQAANKSLLAVVLACAGVVVVLLRRRWKMIPVLVVPFLLPVPFFLIPVTHWYTEKYFIAALPSLLIFVAIALSEVVRFMALLIYRVKARSGLQDRVFQWSRSGAISAVLLFLTVEIFAAQYYTKDLYEGHLIPNWKVFAENMRDHMTGNDVIVHFAPMHLNPRQQRRISFEPTPYSFNWYLKRQVAQGRGDLYPTQHLLTASAAELDHWLRKYPYRTFWVVYFITEPAIPVSGAQSKLLKHRILGRGNALFVAGAPTRNLIENADIDPTKAEQLDIKGKAAVAERNLPFNPGHCLKLEVEPGNEVASVTFPLLEEDTETSPGYETSGDGYALSMDMEYEGVQGSVHTSGTLAVSVISLRGDGTTTTEVLRNFLGNQPWQFHSFVINQATHPDVEKPLAVKIELSGSSGSVSIDRIQFEKGNRPTPFIDGERYRHDKALDLLERQIQSEKAQAKLSKP